MNEVLTEYCSGKAVFEFHGQPLQSLMLPLNQVHKALPQHEYQKKSKACFSYSDIQAHTKESRALRCLRDYRHEIRVNMKASILTCQSLQARQRHWHR